MPNITPRKQKGDKVESFLLKSKARLYCLAHLKDTFRLMRQRRHHIGMQLKTTEAIKVVHAIEQFDQCNLLVFGLGNDSPFWCEANKNGRTVFLEDYQPWYDKITGKYPEIEAYNISYPCNITQWQELIDQPNRLKVDLTADIPDTPWNVILVDGPRGHEFSKEIPGRMSSIYMASQLVGKGGYVFVHDGERHVEKTFSEKYLGKEHFVEKIRGRSLLLIYRF